jgi:hypothetical protein
VAVVEEAVGDGVELAAGGAHVVEDEDVASLDAGCVGDGQDRPEFGRGGSLLGGGAPG